MKSLRPSQEGDDGRFEVTPKINKKTRLGKGKVTIEFPLAYSGFIFGPFYSIEYIHTLGQYQGAQLF